MHDEATDGLDADVEIMEDGEEGKLLGPVPAAVGGQPDLTPAMYRIGRSHVTEEELDGYVGRGLINALLRDLCCAPSQEVVSQPEPYEAIVFRDFFKAGLRFPCGDFVGKTL